MRIDLNAIIPEAPDPGQSAKSSGQVGSGESGHAGWRGQTRPNFPRIREECRSWRHG